MMTTYFIEPEDWEAATGERLPDGVSGIVVVPVADVQEETLRLRKALQDIIRHQEIMGGPLSRVSAIKLIAQKALE